MQRRPPSRRPRHDEHSAAEPQPNEFGTPFPRRRFPVSKGGRTFAVPEGRRRRLAGGKSAAADAAPGNRGEWLRAPAGHRRNGRNAGHSVALLGSGVGCPTCGGRQAVAETPRAWRRQKLLRCPAGAGLVRRGNRGPRPLARACPRLISCGVPPGRGANRRRQFFGSLIAVGERQIPCGARGFRRAGGPRPQRTHTREAARNSGRPGSAVAAATGDRSRSALVAASLLCVHRVSVVHHHRLD